MAVEDFTQVKISHQVRHDYSGPGNTTACWSWACEQFGDPGFRNSEFRWQWDTQQTFYFRDRADAVLFALKWAK